MAMMTDTTIRVLVADDHHVLREGVDVMCRKEKDITVVGEVSDGEALLRFANILQPDIAIVDINMPVMDGVAATRALTKEFPGIGIIAFTMYDEDELIIEMLEAGASGYIIKTARQQDLLEAIRTVHIGKEYYCRYTSQRLAALIARSRFNPKTKKQTPEFTGRELTVIRLICEDLSNKQIAARMQWSIRTVEAYRLKIQAKMEVHGSAGIVISAIRKRIFLP